LSSLPDGPHTVAYHPQDRNDLHQFHLRLLIGEGGDGPVSFDFEALQRTVAFMATPHLLAVMDSIEGGRQPHQALPGVMPEQIDAAVQRLLDVGAVRKIVPHEDLAIAAASGSICPWVLTRKGRQVLELLRDLREPPTSAPVFADGEGAVLTSEQLTE
jgi:hypothetical protein